MKTDKRFIVHQAGGVFLVLDTAKDNAQVFASYNQRDARTDASYRNNYDPDGAFTRVLVDHPTNNSGVQR